MSQSYDPASPPRYDAAEVPSSPRRSTNPTLLDAVPLSPSLPSHPIGPDASPYIRIRKAPSPPQLPLHREKQSILDELLPTPTAEDASDSGVRVLRRIGALAVLVIFFLAISFLACTTETLGLDQTASGLRKVFGAGNVVGQESYAGSESIAEDVETTSTTSASVADTTEGVKPSKDFDQYTMFSTLPGKSVDIKSKGKRVIFIGDVHGSFDPLRRLMDKLNYKQSDDVLIHVGDLVAKGNKNREVLAWMAQRQVLGVRGNHDQPVVQWRAWMEWAGGAEWEAYIESLSSGGEKGVVSTLTRHGKMFPTDWEWKGEHWHIARNLAKHHYAYLLQLPLVLHLPSLHTLVVHAGLLPSDPSRSANDANQPLVEASHSTSSPNYDASLARPSEELTLLLDVPQNTLPWNLMNMRSVYVSGNHQGEVTKSSKKGKPWSDVWKKEMKRCKGAGAWYADGMGEWDAEHDDQEDSGMEDQEDAEGDELEDQERRDAADADEEGDLQCSPVTVIYGHAAGRGLDIKPFSKGIDTGCVYGRQLSALVIGDISGLKGESVRVGDAQGILVSVECGKGGT